MPNEILDGMTREEALSCIREDGMVFIHGESVCCPGDVALMENCPEDNTPCGIACAPCWKGAVNAYYDAKEENK